MVSFIFLLQPSFTTSNRSHCILCIHSKNYPNSQRTRLSGWTAMWSNLKDEDGEIDRMDDMSCRPFDRSSHPRQPGTDTNAIKLVQ